LEEFLARREPAGDEPRCSFRGIPAPEVLDHRLWVHGSLGVGGELPHGRRPPQALGRSLKLLDDLLVGVALADSRLELRERITVDRGEKLARIAAGHGKKCRANSFRCK